MKITDRRYRELLARFGGQAANQTTPAPEEDARRAPSRPRRQILPEDRPDLPSAAALPPVARLRRDAEAAKAPPLEVTRS